MRLRFFASGFRPSHSYSSSCSSGHPSDRSRRSAPLSIRHCLAAAVGALLLTGEISRPAFSQTFSSSESWLATSPQTTMQPLEMEGTRIYVNGRTVIGNWSQRDQRIGLSDSALTQVLGADLLDSANPAVQPIQWFSDPATLPLNLSTWFTTSYRYLDVTDVLTALNWQVSANGTTLIVTTPPSQITGVRHSRQSWGDRIVVDLQQPSTWQMTSEGNTLFLTLDAVADAPTIQAITTSLRSSNSPIASVTTQNNQTILQLRTTLQKPEVLTLPNPNRLVVDLRNDAGSPRTIAWAPGIQWREETVSLGTSQFPVVSLVIDPRVPGVSLSPIWGNPGQVVGTTPLVSSTRQWGAIAAINAGFFNRNNENPLGAIRQEGRWISGPILNRGAIAWDEAGNVLFGRLRLQETATLSSGETVSVLHLNSGYVQAGTSRYTPDWGSAYIPLIDNEVIVTVRNNQVVGQQRAGTAGSSSYAIPSDGYLLVVRSDSRIANALTNGTTVQIASAHVPAQFESYPNIIGGGPLLVQNRQVVLNAEAEQFTTAFIQQRAVRSAIGVLADGQLMLTTMQNRVGGSGPSLSEAAQIMLALGATDALNLDGGSSTTLLLAEQVLNRPPSSVARVHGGIGVFLEPGN